MAFRAGKTGARQTAVNAAATITSALIGQGVLIDAEDVIAKLTSIRDELFDDLVAYVAEDNETFEAAEKAAPKRSGGSRPTGGKNGSGGKAISADTAREVELTWGKFKGVTLGELESMSVEDAEEYGYDKSGLDYLKYLSRNDSNDFMATRATSILKARRASSEDDE
jgi:hypothetical protein